MAAAGAVLPVGSIVAFAGGMDLDWLREQGWLYCDGAALEKTEYLDLYMAIGSNYGGGRATFNVPDLRGRFVRGVDGGAGRDYYVTERQPSAPGGLAGNQPGSVFGYRTTWTEDRPFSASEHDGHVHPVPHAPKDGNAYQIAGEKYGIWRDSPSTTGENGRHTHQVTGGDKETRPINKAVFFIIKFRDEPKGEQ